jgi:hypothetical protein
MDKLLHATSEVNLLENKYNIPIGRKNFTQLLKKRYCPTHEEIVKLCNFFLEDPSLIYDIFPHWSEAEWIEKDRVWLRAMITHAYTIRGINYE